MKLKSVILSAVIVLLSLGCDDKILEQNADSFSDDELIKSIQLAPYKQQISVEDLPGSCISVLEQDYFDSYVENAFLAPQLGYEVEIREGEGAYAGDTGKRYFNLRGRELHGSKGRGKDDTGSKYNDKCFTLVLPVSFVLPDGSVITVEDKDDWEEIKNWYEANPDNRERPVPQFPLDIIFKDGTTVTINSQEELHEIHESCRGEDRGGWGACFELVYPVTYFMPDGTTLIISSKEDMAQLRAWYEEHPEEAGPPELQFPVDLKFKDDTVVTVNNHEEMRAALARCGEGWGEGRHGGHGNKP